MTTSLEWEWRDFWDWVRWGSTDLTMRSAMRIERNTPGGVLPSNFAWLKTSIRLPVGCALLILVSLCVVSCWPPFSDQYRRSHSMKPSGPPRVMQGNVAPAFRNIFILAVDFALLLPKDPTILAFTLTKSHRKMYNVFVILNVSSADEWSWSQLVVQSRLHLVSDMVPDCDYDMSSTTMVSGISSVGGSRRAGV